MSDKPTNHVEFSEIVISAQSAELAALKSAARKLLDNMDSVKSCKAWFYADRVALRELCK